jgi:acetylornithine deacetylase/succinyl-diaminopimelate desuccinylase-like protein
MRLVLALLLFVAGGADALAQAKLTTIDPESLKIAAALRDQALERSEAWLILESLTTEVGHRMAGTENDTKGVAWAQDKMKSLGFDKVWIEPVTFPRWVRRHERARIVAPYPHALAVTALGSTPGSGRRPLVAEVIGYATLDALKQARREDVEGRIVFIGNRMRREKDGSGYSPAVAARSEGPSVAAALGAKALLIRSIGTDSHRVPHTGGGISRSAALEDPARAARLERTKSGVAIVEAPIPAAALSNPDADLLSHVLERSQPVRVELELDVGHDGEFTSHNVIGEITGTERPDEVVAIGAHLDSWDLGTGAVDDGTGVAVTMAVGHLLKKMGVAPRRTIRVIAFANEEQGIFGGKAYAKAHAAELDKHLIAAELDAGAGRVWKLETRVAPYALGAIDQIMQVLAPAGVVRGANDQASGGADFSPMREMGLAVADLTQDASQYFDVHHTADDTLDKADPKDLDQLVAVYAAFAYLAAQADGDFGSKRNATPLTEP